MHLPRAEVDLLWQQLCQRLWSEFISSTLYTAVYYDRSLPSDPIGTNTSEPWKTWSPLLAASNVTDVASAEPLSLNGVSLPLAEGPVLSPQIASTRSHASQQIPEGGLVEGSERRSRRNSLDTVSTYDLLPPPYALSDV